MGPITTCARKEFMKELLSQKVSKMEDDNKELRGLASEMIATIMVNRSRGLLKSADEEHFSKLVNKWMEQLRAIESEKPAPKFELMQAVQMRGRYNGEAEARRGIITSQNFSPHPGPGWVYGIQWSGKNEDESAMLEDDLEPAALILKA